MAYVVSIPAMRDDSQAMGDEHAGGNLGRTIRMARLSRGMSQADLADATGAPRPYVSQVESGRVQWPGQYIGRFAVALGLRPSDLGRAGGRIVSDDDFDPMTGARVVEIAGEATGGSSATLTIAEFVAQYDQNETEVLRLWFALSPDDRQAWLSLGKHLERKGAGNRRATPREEEDAG